MQGKRFGLPSARLALAALALLVTLGPLRAQQQPAYPSIRVLTVTPPGGKTGTTVEVTIGGADLDEVNALHFSHPGFKADRVPDPDPKKPGTFIANKFNVTIAGNVPLGNYDVRAVGKWGISNARAFVVGDLNEALDKEPNNDVPQAQKVELNTVVNGTINPNVDVDYYAFAGKRGQRVVVTCQSSSIDSRLNPLVELYGPGNRQLTYNRRYVDRDAVLDYVLPSDGDYLVRICEHAHLAGGAEHFYRLSISLAPWIDAAYPPVLEPGKATQVTLYGRNLPNGQPDQDTAVDGRTLDKLVLPITAPADPMALQRIAYSGMVDPAGAGLDGMEHRVKNAVGSSNPILLMYAQAPLALDNGANDAPDKAQEIPAPCELCGRIERKRDRDWYVFTAKANDVFVIEAFGDRLGSPVDLYFELRRADNKQSIGEFDETPEPLNPATSKFYPVTSDPKTRFVAPADGKYELMVSSRTADIDAGPRHVYRISIRKEKPDFRLVLTLGDENNPGGNTVKQGGSEHLQVICYRQDGFNGEVVVTAEGLPQGVTCPPQVLGPGMRSTALVLTAAADAKVWTGEINIKGTATINGAAVVREARAGGITWPTQPQQNVPAIARLARSLCLAVRDKGPYSLEAVVKEAAVPVGGNLPVKVKVNRTSPDFKAPVQVTAIELPPNLAFNNNNQPVTIAADKGEADVQFQIRNNVPPGVYNLVLRGSAQFPFAKDPMAKQKPNVTVVEPATPIKVTVYNTVANLSTSVPSVNLKPGMDAELIVKVARLNDYKGEFKVQLVLPQGFAGVTAADVTIPAGANEAKLALKCAANAANATNPNVIVRATATIDKINLTHEAKIGVTIAK